MSNLDSPPSIPEGLKREQIAVYQDIIRTVQARSKSFEIPHVVVITDIGKDYDDLTAILVLKELHRLGAIKLEGLIANLAPEHQRAHYARKVLDFLGLRDIPVGQGTRGEPVRKETNPPAAFEFPKEIMGEEPYTAQPNGLDLMQQLGANALEGQYKLTFLLISSLQDITEFKRHLQPDPMSQVQPLKDITSRVILQGAYHLESEPNAPPSNAPRYPLGHAVLKAEHVANNDWNRPDAEEFHAFLDQQSIPSVVYTRNAAFETPLSNTIFKDLAATEQLLGVALYDIERLQNLAFYAGACRTPPAYPGRDQEWFLTNRSTFYDQNPLNTPEEDLPNPNSEHILQYCKVIVYDALAALGTSGDDILDALDVLKKPRYADELVHSKLHRVVGIDLALYRKIATENNHTERGTSDQSSVSLASTNPEKMKNVIEALLMGALLDSHCSSYIEHSRGFKDFPHTF
ncbi:hypothetical protein DSL72_008947 [Monilinia vaccinii-corymbosi]|uniref:Inosine/uridine-preferring nucleoside hydrolase domain-containing protein n=1 Tax=Monilinia vaccinii-corymbosi TaxID=61207 RepID=A0A8A3PQN2_9HELO|nr:hypothetical protein DSL72_008947 [Monilinia vaccinii-corymbosi]